MRVLRDPLRWGEHPIARANRTVLKHQPSIMVYAHSPGSDRSVSRAEASQAASRAPPPDRTSPIPPELPTDPPERPGRRGQLPNQQTKSPHSPCCLRYVKYCARCRDQQCKLQIPGAGQREHSISNLKSRENRTDLLPGAAGSGNRFPLRWRSGAPFPGESRSRHRCR